MIDFQFTPLAKSRRAAPADVGSRGGVFPEVATRPPAPPPPPGHVLFQQTPARLAAGAGGRAVSAGEQEKKNNKYIYMLSICTHLQGYECTDEHIHVCACIQI